MWRIVLVALVGCDAVFGLQAIKPDAPVVVDETTVHGGYAALVIEPDGFGGYLPAHEQPTPSQASVVLDDGEPAPVAFAEDLSFTFKVKRPGQAYRLSYVAFDGSGPITLINNVRDLELMAALFGRYDRVPITAPTLLNVTVPTTSKTAWVFTTGLRTALQVNETPNPRSSFSVDWRTMQSLSGPAGLPSAARYDTVYFADYDIVPLKGYYRIYSIASQPLTLVDGAPTSISMTPMPPALGRCVRLTANRSDEQNRARAAIPGATSVTSLWAIQATPDPLTAAPLAGQMLAYEDTTIDMPVTEDVTYANPLPGERQIVRMQVIVQHDIGAGLIVSSVTHHWAPLPVTSVCDASSEASISGTVAIATQPQLDAQPLTGPLSVSAGRLTFDASNGGADYFVVNVYEVGTAAPLVRYLVAEPAVTLDPALLQSGHSYYFLINTIQGYPKASGGDFRPIAYPFGRSSVFTPVFTVR